ncbi:XRE family transcriptional regulator [Corynebacterium ammoniagenes]|uniref:XRE family transcriptional regulator n=1 Tax=Corynebacterium ammoniagenes TaxID=1697 RepID=UPI001F0E1301|nr:XRE family transcriptional regulator [Corynebacterium ammoniagenes]
MKRITAAAVAAVTALSLSTGVSTGVASAQGLGTGSTASDSQIRKDLLKWQAESPFSGTLLKQPTSSVSTANQSSEFLRDRSSERVSDEVIESSWGLAKSSVKKDIENGDPIGTNLDILLALGSVLAVGAIIYNVALQAGMPLPHVAAE